MADLLAIVPARAGSRGLPGKALRTVGGVPMILRTLRALAAARVPKRIVVSTNDPEVKSFCELRGFEVLDRPDELARPEVPVLDVARAVARDLAWTGDLGIFQPTSPLLTSSRIEQVWGWWLQDQRREWGWMVTALADHRISHRWNPTLSRWLPIGERVNRQWRQPIHHETGAIQLLRQGKPEQEAVPCVVAMPANEAVDVDDANDLFLANGFSRLARIEFVVATGVAVGTGHVSRCSALVRALGHHQLRWRWVGHSDASIANLLGAEADSDNPPGDRRLCNLTIFDCLTPTEEQLLEARQRGKVVVLEDETEQSRRYADLLVNELLDPADLRYAVIRPEFLELPVMHRKDSRRVLLTFGGTDPSELTPRVRRALDSSGLDLREPTGHMARDMALADLVITSQGRTVLEAACAGRPCISIAANERESHHTRLGGVIYLGLHTTITDETIRQTVTETLRSKGLREEMANTAGQIIDGRGTDRLVHAIEGLLL